jgi:trafficking protein particle complex subunit 4
MIYSLLIINKAGGLVYNREYNEGISRLSSNDYLVLAGTFHGYFQHPPKSVSDLFSVHAITAQISPVPNSSGIEVLETNEFRLQCFQTHTGSTSLLVVMNDF